MLSSPRVALSPTRASVSNIVEEDCAFLLTVNVLLATTSVFEFAVATIVTLPVTFSPIVSTLSLRVTPSTAGLTVYVTDLSNVVKGRTVLESL